MMPELSRLDMCRLARSSTCSDVSIIFVTAWDTLDDKLAGFEVGGDDYLVKPFALAELKARIEALQARNERRMSPTLSYGPVFYDLNTHRVTISNQELTLNPIQKKILHLLLIKAPKSVSSCDIEFFVWGDEPPEGSTYRTQVYRLRKALPNGFLVTVRGNGYRLNDSF